VSEDPWTCPCGHEIDQETRDCIVWDRHRQRHLVPRDGGVCRCHGYAVGLIEAWGSP
jgi:hypothetical protein